MSILTAALENCLEVQWKEQYECVLSPDAPPISLEASQRIIEILKILFNITYSTHRQEPSEVSDAECIHGLLAFRYHLKSGLLPSNSLYSRSDQDDAALYRHLVALLRVCLMKQCLLPDDTDELQG